MRKILQLLIRREDHKHDGLGALFLGAARDDADWRDRLRRYLGPAATVRAVVNERDCLRVSVEIRDFPTESANLSASAQRLAAHGLHRAALGHYLEAIRLSPLNAEALRALGRLYAERGDLADAHTALVKAREAAGDDADTLRLLGLIALQQGRRSSAVAYLQQSLALDPQNRATQAALGSLERRAGRAAGAGRDVENEEDAAGGAESA